MDQETLITNYFEKTISVEDQKIFDSLMETDVDFAKEGMQGSSLEETLTIDQIVKSLLDLGTVDKVQFLLDGEVSETLMGHLSTDEAFTGESQ